MVMAQFTGRLQGTHLEPSTVLIDITDGRFRVSAGRIQIGSWPMARIRAERTSIYRFELQIEDDHFDFFPDDPSAFSNEVGAVVDLTESKNRFGLKARIERVANS
jgi:hypothetical protein